MNEKLNELLQDESIVRELVAKENAEDVQKFLADKGVEVSIEDINAIRDGVLARVENNDEMSDDQLEQVAGGGGYGDVIKFGVDCIVKVGDCIHTLTRGRW
jgi:ATP-dependent RNA circularization protein (DNA/RNA ligase family)